MKKINKILLLFVTLMLFTAKPARATTVNCNFVFTPPINQITQDNDAFSVDITSGELTPGNYKITYAGKDEVVLPYNGGVLKYSKKKMNPFSAAGTFNVVVEKDDKSLKCVSPTINIQDSPLQTSCNITFSGTKTDPATGAIIGVSANALDQLTQVGMTANNIKAGAYDLYVDGSKKGYYSNLAGNTIVLGNYPLGSHNVSIKDPNLANRLQRPAAAFQVNAVGATPPPGGGGGGAGTGPLNLRYCPPPPGSPADQIRIDTAIGCIPINTSTDFAAWILGWFIGIAGGIAFLLMLWGGFQIMTAGGNPDQVKTGQEQLTAAISGLLLIIFAIFLLKLIGVSIFQIPGLT